MSIEHLHEDFALCYRAVCSRDARFDGRFFTAVTSTGIYCRPICAAQTPQSQHVRFFACAAAAEAAGFRACRRCHPEASPGSPDWNMRADLVARALRLIAEGIVDSEGVAGLARRLAVSERHLHRLLLGEIGAGPLALARTRRAQTARLLIDQTDLPLTTVAFASGFASIRQFNETMQASFGCAPSELRRRPQTSLSGEGRLTLRLAARPPFDGEGLLTWLGRRTIPGVEEVDMSRYRRTITLPHAVGILEVEPTAKDVKLRLRLDDLRDLSALVQRVRHLFDLDADPGAINTVLAEDDMLAPLVAMRPGLRVPGTVDGFEMAVRAILGQQISVAGARTLAGRLVMRYGEPLSTPEGGLTHRFPRPEALAEADIQGLGITTSRVAALRRLAQEVVAGRIMLDRGADREETAANLLKLPGFGPWTVGYLQMRALGDPDAWPSNDLGLKHACAALGVAGPPDTQRWRPWRSYAALHLWASLPEPSMTTRSKK